MVQTGYDTYLLLPRYLLNENESGDFTLIDRQDDVGYIASDQFQSPAWSFLMEALKMVDLVEKPHLTNLSLMLRHN